MPRAALSRARYVRAVTGIAALITDAGRNIPEECRETFGHGALQSAGDVAERRVGQIADDEDGVSGCGEGHDVLIVERTQPRRLSWGRGCRLRPFVARDQYRDQVPLDLQDDVPEA